MVLDHVQMLLLLDCMLERRHLLHLCQELRIALADCCCAAGMAFAQQTLCSERQALLLMRLLSQEDESVCC